MDLARPFAVVTPTIDGDVLQALAGADTGFTGRGVHRLIGRRSQEGVRRALDRLTAQGIVGAETVGASTVYRLNRAHLAAPHIEAIAQLRGELLTRLRARLDGWEIRPAYAALFGSAARGDMQAGSDIDLFVVRPAGVDPDDADWLDQVHTLVRDVAIWTGNDVRPVELAEDEALTAARDKRGVVADVAADGIHLAGPSGFLRRKR